MKGIKRTAILFFAALWLLTAAFLLGTGLTRRGDVVLVDYAVSGDGSELSFRVGVASSMGYVRDFRDSGGGVKPHYLAFYSCFGGLNSRLGAKNEFILELGPEDTEIWFSRPGGGYELVLAKDPDTGLWIRPGK